MTQRPVTGASLVITFFLVLSSVKISRLVKPRLIAASHMSLTAHEPRLRYSAFGSISIISTRNSSRYFEGFMLVVTTVLGGSRCEKCSENSSNESSAAMSGSSGPTIVSSTSRVLSSVFCCNLQSGAASPSASASFCRFLRALRLAASPSFFSFWKTSTRLALHRIPLSFCPSAPRRPLPMLAAAAAAAAAAPPAAGLTPWAG